ncbi:MAG: TlpA disulfide reductase family protein [Anaerolineae bacterium]
MTTLLQPAASKRRFPLKTVVLLIAAAVVLLLAALLLSQNTPTASGGAPEFTLTTLAGETLRLRDLRGQVVVLNFWATWCEHCRIEMPDLQALSEAYAHRGVLVVGVAYGDQEGRVRDFIRDYGITYPIGLDMSGIGDAYQLAGVPQTIVIDPQGRVDTTYYAAFQPAQISAVIERLLNAS